MAELFKVKIRQIGSSAGILIPQERLQQEEVHIGDVIEMAILPNKKDFSGFGIAKHARIPFTRNKKTRTFV